MTSIKVRFTSKLCRLVNPCNGIILPVKVSIRGSQLMRDSSREDSGGDMETNKIAVASHLKRLDYADRSILPERFELPMPQSIRVHASVHLYPLREGQSSTILFSIELSVSRIRGRPGALPPEFCIKHGNKEGRRASIRHCLRRQGNQTERMRCGFQRIAGRWGMGGGGGGYPGRPHADASAIPEINSLPARVRRRAGTVPAAPPLCNTPAGRGGERGGRGESGYPFRRWAVPA